MSYMNNASKVSSGRKHYIAPHQRGLPQSLVKSRVLRNSTHGINKTLAVDNNFTLDVKNYGVIRRLSVHMRLKCTTAEVTLGSLQKLLDLTKVYNGKNSSDAFKNYRGDELLIMQGLSASLMPNDRDAEDSNFHGIRGQNGDTLAVDESRDYYIDFDNFPLLGVQSEHAGAFSMEFSLRKGCVRSGDASNVTIEVFEIVLKEDALDATQQKEHRKIVGQGSEVHYLDCTVTQTTNVALAAGVPQDLPFTVKGNCIGHTVMIRPTSHVADGGKALTDFKYIGGSAEIMTTGATSDKNLVSSDGSADTWRDLQRATHMKFGEHSNVVFIPYTSNFMTDLTQQTHSGSYNFGGEEHDINIKPAAAVTNAVYTFNCTNPANDGGSYKLKWGGESTVALAYNATVAQMKAAFEDLQVMKDYDLTATFSATASTDFLLTIGNANFDVNRKFGMVGIDTLTLNDGTVAEVCSVTNSTRYVDGSDLGAGTYDVTILSWVWYKVKSHGGKTEFSKLAVGN